LTPEAFIDEWTKRLNEYRAVAAHVDGEKICERVLADFNAVREAEAHTVLTLAEAAIRSGYSEEHLGRLVRQGKIPNAGRRGAPRIPVGDLPRRPITRAAGPLSAAYDPVTDARTLLNRRKGGNHGLNPS